MSFLSMIPIVGELFKGAKDLISEAIVDKDKKNEISARIKTLQIETENKILEMQHNQLMGQIQVNQEEAKSKSLFVAGWRPAVGWTCCAIFAYNYLVQPMAIFVLAACGVDLPTLPKLDVASIMPVLMGMLGLAGMRSFEKNQGINNK